MVEQAMKRAAKLEPMQLEAHAAAIEHDAAAAGESTGYEGVQLETGDDAP